jgi:hypothetical protein
VAEALVDPEDYELVSAHRWHLSEGYPATNVLDPRGGLRSDGKRLRRRVLRMHRLLMGCVPGDGVLVDHRNRNKLDNRRGNLRKGTRAVNSQNTSSRRGSTSRYRGVHWDRGRWVAKARRPGGEVVHLGRFVSEREAAEVVRAWLRTNQPGAEVDRV